MWNGLWCMLCAICSALYMLRLMWSTPGDTRHVIWYMIHLICRMWDDKCGTLYDRYYIWCDRLSMLHVQRSKWYMVYGIWSALRKLGDKCNTPCEMLHFIWYTIHLICLYAVCYLLHEKDYICMCFWLYHSMWCVMSLCYVLCAMPPMPELPHRHVCITCSRQPAAQLCRSDIK